MREMPHVLLAPAQRLEVWANFGDRPGDDVWLESRAFTGLDMGMGMGRMGMGRGMMMGRASGAPNGAPFRIQRFATTRPGALVAAPQRLIALSGPAASVVANAGHPRTFLVSMQMMRWLLLR